VRRLLLLLIAGGLLGNATASGSVTINAGVLQEELKVAAEQRITTYEGFEIYAGFQTEASAESFTLVKPYLLACRDASLVVYASVCGEFAYPIVGQDSLLRVFITVAW